MTDVDMAWLADLEKTITDIEALIAAEETPFARDVRLYRAIGGHPDVLEALKAAAAPGDLDGIRLVPIAFGEPKTLYAGEVIAKLAGRVPT